jgi:hypothetical protein
MAGKKLEQLQEFVDSVNKKDNPHNGFKIKRDFISKVRKSKRSRSGR